MFALDLWPKPDFHEIMPSIDEIHYRAHLLALLGLRRQKVRHILQPFPRYQNGCQMNSVLLWILGMEQHKVSGLAKDFQNAFVSGMTGWRVYTVVKCLVPIEDVTVSFKWREDLVGCCNSISTILEKGRGRNRWRLGARRLLAFRDSAQAFGGIMTCCW